MTSGMIWTFYDLLNNSCCFLVPIYGPYQHGCGQSTEMRPHLQAKKTKVRLYKQQKAFYALYITSKTEHFSFKRGCVVWKAKHLKEDWLVVNFSFNIRKIGSEQQRLEQAPTILLKVLMGDQGYKIRLHFTKTVDTYPLE